MPSIYIYKKYIDWLTVSNAGMHIEASKAREEDRCSVEETKHVPVGEDEWNETETISQERPHGKRGDQAAVESTGQKHLGLPKRTMIHNDRQMWCWHEVELHNIQWGRKILQSVSFKRSAFF